MSARDDHDVLEGEVRDIRRGADKGDRVRVDAVPGGEAAHRRVRSLGQEERDLRVRVVQKATGEALERCGGLLEEDPARRR